MKNRKPVFFTSDWHLFHKNVLQFSNRPFKNINHMHETLIRNYNSVVPENGVCYFLGDIGFADVMKVRNIITRLNGRKVCVKGNHDKSYGFLYNVGFDLVLNSASIILGKELITMSHFPLLDLYREDTSGMNGSMPGENWHREGKYSKVALENRDQFHLHGHIHSPNNGQSKRIEGRQFDVGVDANNYRPVSISQIESFIANYNKKDV